jgi:hypothetical protein
MTIPAAIPESDYSIPTSKTSFAKNLEVLSLVPFVKLENIKSGRDIGFVGPRNAAGAESNIFGISSVNVKLQPNIGYVIVTCMLSVPMGALKQLSIQDNQRQFPQGASPGAIVFEGAEPIRIETIFTSDLHDLLEVGGRWDFEFGWRDGNSGKKVNQLKTSPSPGLNRYTLVLISANASYNNNIKGLDISLEFISSLNNTLSGIPIKALELGKLDKDENLKKKSILYIIDKILQKSKSFIASSSENNLQELKIFPSSNMTMNSNSLFNSDNIYLNNGGWDIDPIFSTEDIIPSISDITFIITSVGSAGTVLNGIQMLQQKPTNLLTFTKILSDQPGDMSVWSFLSEFLKEHAFDLMPYYPAGDKGLIAYNTSCEAATPLNSTSSAVSFQLANNTYTPSQGGIVIQKNWVPAFNPLNYNGTIIELSIDTNAGTATYASVVFDTKMFKQLTGAAALQYGASSTISGDEENEAGRDFLYSNYTQWINSSKLLKTTILGEPRMYIQDTIVLEGMTEVFNGIYVVQTLSHNIDMNLFTSTLECLRISNSTRAFLPETTTAVEESYNEREKAHSAQSDRNLMTRQSWK